MLSIIPDALLGALAAAIFFAIPAAVIVLIVSSIAPSINTLAEPWVCSEGGEIAVETYWEYDPEDQIDEEVTDILCEYDTGSTDVQLSAFVVLTLHLILVASAFGLLIGAATGLRAMRKRGQKNRSKSGRT